MIKVVALATAVFCLACSQTSSALTRPSSPEVTQQNALLTQPSQEELDLTAELLSKYHGQSRSSLAALLEEKPNQIGIIAHMRDPGDQQIVDKLLALRRMRKLQSLHTPTSR